MAWLARKESYRAHTRALVEQARGRQEDRLDLALLLSLEVDRRGNTLDEAYDEGGPGAGRTIVADAGPVNIEGWDGLRVSSTDVMGGVFDITLTPQIVVK